MLRTRQSRVLAFVALLAVASPGVAAAHHGWGNYDSSRAVTLTGTIEQSSYGNPHGTVVLRTSEGVWEIILAPPARMSNRGLPENMLAVGNTATVEGYVHKTHAGELRAERITIDGTTVELR